MSPEPGICNFEVKIQINKKGQKCTGCPKKFPGTKNHTFGAPQIAIFVGTKNHTFGAPPNCDFLSAQNSYFWYPQIAIFVTSKMIKFAI